MAEADPHPSICSVNPPALRLQPRFKMWAAPPYRSSESGGPSWPSGTLSFPTCRMGAQDLSLPTPSRDLFRG